MVAEAITNGASTTNQIAAACGAGADCGRCRRTLRSLLGVHRRGLPSGDAG
jgi:bacterioferritin-associated ferredoxin